MTSTKKCPVFISYAMEDGKEYAETLKNVLDGIGFQTFVAHKNIPAGFRNPAKRMLEAVDECQFFVLLLTSGACKSEPVQKEIAKAIEGNKIIIACKRNDVPRKEIPSDFIKNDVQRIKFENVESLAKQVVHILIETEHRFLDESGISRVFLSRQDPEYSKELENCFLNSTSEEILMLGISLRDWFGKKSPQHKFANLIEGAPRKGTKFKVLIVDPTSEIARERAMIEEGPDFDQKGILLESDLYKDIKNVINWIKDPQVDADTKSLMKENVKPRCYDSSLSVYVIKTANFMFVEQYHTGKIGVLRKNKIGNTDDWCHGGYVPVFLVRNNSDFGRLISDHFNNIWEKSQGNDLNTMLAKIRVFEANPRNFRIEQFLKSIHKGCEDLLPN